MSILPILTTSPQRADPLAWVLSVNLPLAGAIASAGGGTALTIILARQGASAAAIIIATALATLGCLVVMHEARPNRPLMRASRSVLPAALGLASMAVSAVGHLGSTVRLEEWSGPLGLATVMLALVPYSPAVLTAIWGAVGAVTAAALAWWAFDVPGAGPLGVLIAGSSVPLHVGLGGAVFSCMVVAGVQRWRALPYDREESSERSRLGDRLREHGATVAVGDDVVSLLQRVTERGRVTTKEREDAAALAAGIRSELVRMLDRSWLETIPQRDRLTIEDPELVANRMTRPQRAAVHALITAALESPVVAGENLRLELRALEDGTTAVALSMDITLPEGRRVMMLAPYFISLKASVDDLEWDVGEQLRMHFKLPPPEGR